MQHNEYYGMTVTSNCCSIILNLSKSGLVGFEVVNLGSSRILGHSGSDRVRFWVVWSWVISDSGMCGFGSGFGLSDFGSSRISDRSSSGQVRFQVLSSQVISDFGSFKFGSGCVRVSLTF
jgi:hypothetical protein